MAESRDNRDSNFLSPLEEQLIQESEADGDLEQQLLTEKELVAQRLWIAFQDSATAVAHLFRDCQQHNGLAAWAPFHDSANAITQLYKGSAEVCRQCMECGVRYGQRKKTKDIVAWAKKKRRLIKREELLAFLLDKPYPPDPSSTERMDDVSDLSMVHQRPLQSTCGTVAGHNCLQTPCCTSPLPSPRRGRALFREDQGDNDMVYSSVRDTTSGSNSGGVRKRQTNLSSDFTSESPLPKRFRL